jgi:predicted kinase
MIKEMKMNQKGKLIFFCGKMGSGKSTKSKEIAKDMGAILLSEDEWLSAIYPNEIEDFNSYIKYSMRIKPLVKSHVQNILNIGINVVMDFPANTKKQRQWFIDIFSEHNIPHKLFYIEADDQLCLKQIEQRRLTNPERHNFDTEEVFHHVNSFFQPPSVDEAFNIEIIDRKNE